MIMLTCTANYAISRVKESRVSCSEVVLWGGLGGSGLALRVRKWLSGYDLEQTFTKPWQISQVAGYAPCPPAQSHAESSFLTS